ncbi:hypothetical protein C2S53_010108 [Perilla frutescens var. hirtella]|uniref:PB1 domain-containing protein n=1 Tax=Perilla frutescens var. hirtella TaxID=608512 RepID=A0AAD4JBH7_PERFH|nr:hypothetical protein C2S53_010108 [Perilla frutescens var. hirtella]
MEASKTQTVSISHIKNLMSIPLSYAAGNSSISDWHVFSDDREESELRNPISNFSNLITKKKIKAALELFDFINFPSLVQFWSPTISRHQHQFLDSSDLPFALSRLRKGVSSFRKHCSNYRYNLQGDRCGPPGRVFRGRFPEFCPDIRYYTDEEFELKELAMAAGFRGYLCLPVYEPDWHFCIGVLEVFTIMDGSYCFGDVIERVSASLKGPAQYKLAVNEIKNVLDVLCRTYKLPFAQIWVATSGGSSEESFISPAEMGSFSSIRRVSSFQRDCNWFHLRKGQGIVWKAFLSGTCFCRDLTKLSIVNYALVLSARKVDFTSGFAICLQSTYTGNHVAYIIELFLPPNQTIYRQPWIFLTSLLDTMKQLFKTFRLRTGQKIGSDLPAVVLQTSEDDLIDPFVKCKTIHAGEGLKNKADITQRKPAEPLIFDTGANGSGPDSVKIKENTASSSYVSKFFQNGKMVLSHDTTTNNRSNELNPQQIMPAKIGTMKTLSSGEAVSTTALENPSGNKLTIFPDNPKVKRSMSNNTNPAPDINGGPPRKRSRIGHSSKEHIVESIQQSSSCCVSAPEEGPILLSPVAAPMQNRESIMTVKADFEGDVIKFRVPAACGILKLKHEVTKRLKLNAATFEIKYHREDNIWVVLDTDAKLLEYVRSLGMNTIKLSIMSIVPQPEAAENAIKMTVKASYEDDLIKFEFALSAGISELKNEMIKRLKLDDGCFEIKYTDENNCPMLLDSDAALQNCINKVKSLQKTVMRLSIQPIRSRTAVSNECIMTVKASYGDDIIKFKLSLSSGMMNLKDEVTKRLKLEAGSFVVKYLDEDSNEVLVDGDAALTKYMSAMTSMGIYTVKISLQPIDQQA